MDLINNNPYRIAGILSNASERELQKQKAKIKAYVRVGKEIKSEYDFNILADISRTEDSVNKAFSQVEQNLDKVHHALFWFMNISPFDHTAIEYLKQGQDKKAIEIWEKVTSEKDVNSRNFSSLNNLGTYKLLSKIRSDIKMGIEAKIRLIESDFFEDFVHSVADETYTIDNQKQAKILIDELHSTFMNQYADSETMYLFSGCNGSTKKYISHKFTEEPLHHIERQIERCKSNRKEKRGNAYDYGLSLFENTKKEIFYLKSIFGISDLKYRAIADQLANEIMQCGIDYFNESQKNDSSKNYLQEAQELNKTALTIAVGKLARDRAEDHIATLEEMKDHEVIQSIVLLKSIKDAYETNEENIRRHIQDLKDNDPQIRLGYRSINEPAVENSIKNSIDWNKVNDLLKEVLTDECLVKIKASSNLNLKSEFIELVNWLKEHSQRDSLIIQILEKYKKIAPNLAFKIVSSQIQNTDVKSILIDKPLYSKFIRYIGLNLKVEAKEESTVRFYLKYINPNGSIKRNSNSSPAGYSQVITQIIKPQTRSIKFPGWGVEDKCTYAIGLHRIEVYVDEYLIHSKEYKVDLSPSDKIKKEITIAEKQLTQIKQMSYYKSEIRSARNEISEIQKFKWFRTSDEKQIQVETQRMKIEELIEKAKKDKLRDIETQERKINKLKIELSKAKY